jgi:MATE family multidrug resistance protein
MLSYSIMTLVDTLLVGHLGAAALAGVGLGGTASFALLCFPLGLLRGAKTLVAQAVGARRPDLVEAYRAAAITAALVLGVVMIAIGQAVASLLAHVTASPPAGHAAELYLQVRNLSAPAVLLGCALREVRYGEGDARSPMLAAVAANIVNAALALLLVFALHRGVAGAATAAALSSTLETLILWLLGRRAGCRSRGLGRAHLAELWRIGIPTALQFTLEVGAFVVLASMISSMSENQMAAHQIALQVCQFSFLPAFAVAESASVLAGQAVGARRDELVARVGRLGLWTAGGYTGACGLAFALGAPLIVDGFGFRSDAALTAVAVRLLHVAALFQVFDGANIVARSVLRGVGDVRFAAVVGVVTSWVLTPPLTWLLGWRCGLGAFGGWIGLCAETIAGALLLWRRLHHEQWRPAAEQARAAATLAIVDGAEAVPAVEC